MFLHKNKLALKLTAVISVFLAVCGIMIAAVVWFFINGTHMVISDYTEDRLEKIISIAQDFEPHFWTVYEYEDSDYLAKSVEKIADQCSSNCYIVDKDARTILYSADGHIQLSEHERNVVKNNIAAGQNRVNVYRLSRKYMMVSVRLVKINPPNYDYTDSVYFVFVTKEVYTRQDKIHLAAAMILITAGMMAVLVWLAFIFSRRITQPILKMQRVTRQITELDFSHRYVNTSKDELGELSKNIDYMANKIDNLIIELEEKNRQLSQDLERQKELDNMRRQFVAAVSHEFKTPLTVMRGYVEMLEDDISDEKDINQLGIIINKIDVLDNMVMELLELSKLENIQECMNIQKFSMDGLLRDVAQKYVDDGRMAEYDFVFRVNDKSDFMGDRDRIETVVNNFLNNAIKNTARGGRINLSLTVRENVTYVSVYNEGENIPDAECQRIWEPFYRIEGKKERGTGLGLALCRTILEKLGCEYGVQNKKKGVLFFFKYNSL